MSRPKDPPRVSTLGYAIGTGAATVAVAAPVLHFAVPDVATWLHLGGTFAAGAVIGLVLAKVRNLRLGG